MSNSVLCVVKIVNERTGKYQIVESGDTSRIKTGDTSTSLDLQGKDLHSTWRCDIRVTDKGSKKIDSIARHDISGSAFVVSAPAPAPVVEQAQEQAQENKPIVEQEQESNNQEQENNQAESIVAPALVEQASKPIAKALTKDMTLWESSKYYISPDARKIFALAYKFLQSDPYQSVKILLTGQSGFGKTTLVEQAAQFMELSCLRLDCSTMRDTVDWFGRIYVENHNMIFKKSRFTETIEQGNCVIILDEFNRVESNVHNSLFPLLDGAGKTTIENIDIVVGPNVIFCATINQGYQYGGTFDLDEAIKNRFEFILEVKQLPKDHEIALLETVYNLDFSTCESIVNVARTLRENRLVCSTRTTLSIAKMVKYGAGIVDVRDAFEYACIRRIADDEESGQAQIRKDMLDIVNTMLSVQNDATI